MAITALPTPPSRTSPSDFSSKADAFIAALPVFVTEANAQAAALELNSTTADSTTSLAIGTGSKSLTVDLAKSYQPGMSVKIARTASPSNWMHGDVTSYNAGTGALVVNVLDILGSGTFTDWTVTFSAPNLPFATDAEVKARTEAAKVISPATLAALVPALGTANYKQFMNAAGAAPEWAQGLYVGTITRDSAAASGDVSYTGVGFKGAILLTSGGYDASLINTIHGFDDGTNRFCHYHNYDSYLYYTTSFAFLAGAGVTPGNIQTAILKSWDSDGFTLTWTKTGSPAGTIAFGIIVLR